VTINYGAVASATGQIVVGADEAGSCRVAAINVTAADVAAITSVLQAAGGDWHELSADAAAGSATFSGTIGLESAMIVILTPPAGSHWGKAGIMATVMNPAA
jgi:post-segregation antitoxin (ccd killing protein)